MGPAAATVCQSSASQPSGVTTSLPVCALTSTLIPADMDVVTVRVQDCSTHQLNRAPEVDSMSHFPPLNIGSNSSRTANVEVHLVERMESVAISPTNSNDSLASSDN
ncbi:Complement C4-B [Frankliniella fusca]|uniref:Complement C4-B n=1 Tax=Frankliniella fusca TaxID=407009 RepID=A0AAE1LM34_9NEOP|nr:Complement C4-B [Frankliniella fusca]